MAVRQNGFACCVFAVAKSFALTNAHVSKREFLLPERAFLGGYRGVANKAHRAKLIVTTQKCYRKAVTGYFAGLFFVVALLVVFCAVAKCFCINKCAREHLRKGFGFAVVEKQISSK